MHARIMISFTVTWVPSTGILSTTFGEDEVNNDADGAGNDDDDILKNVCTRRVGEYDGLIQ